MFKRKYKLKNKRKIISPYYILIAFAISLMLFSYAYSLLSDKLNINIKSNILLDSINKGKSTYYYEISSSWTGSNANYTVYQIKFYLKNLDGDISSWKFDIDLPEVNPSGTFNCWSASSVSLTGNTLTMLSQDWSGTINNNSTYQFEIQCEIKGNPNDIKKNTFLFNDKKITYYNPNEPSSDDTNNSSNNNTSSDTTNTSKPSESTNESTPNENLKYSDTTYNWENSSHWGGYGSPCTYQILLNITNRQKDYKNGTVEISFDIPKGFLLKESGNCNVWQAENISLSGNTLTIKLNTTYSWISIGDQFTLHLQLVFENEVDFTLSNVIFDGEKAVWVSE